MLLSTSYIATTGSWLTCVAGSPGVVQNTYNYKNVSVNLYTGPDYSGTGGATDYTSVSAQRVNLRAYVTYPPNFPWGVGTRHPVVAMFHGGGWAAGSPASWTPLALFLASQGVVVAQFQYRLTNRFAPDPTSSVPRDATKDAVSAIRWLRKNAAMLMIDPTRIAALGDSAGGHLALVTSMVGPSVSDELGADAQLSSAVQLVLAAYPVPDTSLLQAIELAPADGGAAHYRLVQPPRVHVTAPDLSPQQLMTASNLPPTVILTSLYDTVEWTSAARQQAFLDRARQLLPGQPDRVRIVWFDDGVTVPVLGRQDHNFIPYDLFSGAVPSAPYAAANEVYAQLTLALEQGGFIAGGVEPLATIRARVSSASTACTQIYPFIASYNAAYGYSDGPPATSDPYWRRNFSVW